MNSIAGGVLAVLAIVVGWRGYGAPGVLMALGIVVFWLLLQFSRALRAMRLAGQAPVGQVASAVMLNARLSPGLTMLQVITRTRSLGARVEPGADGAMSAPGEEAWRWRDDGGSHVTLRFAAGKLVRWQLERPASAP